MRVSASVSQRENDNAQAEKCTQPTNSAWPLLIRTTSSTSPRSEGSFTRKKAAEGPIALDVEAVGEVRKGLNGAL